MKNQFRIVFTLAYILSSLIVNVSYAADDIPKFDCTLTDQLSADKNLRQPKESFTKNTPFIYLICDSDTVRKGQTIKSIWIAADTYNIAPANYKIDEKSIEVKQNLTDEQVFTARFSLSKPNKGWPMGSYHVDIYVNNELAQSVKFTVKEETSTSNP